MLKSIVICVAALAVFYVNQVSAVDLIELTDANQAKLNLELSKAVRGIQDAYAKNFEFNTVKDVKKFLFYCEYARVTMAAASDSDFGGLVPKVKALLAEPTIESACSVTTKDIVAGDFEELDEMSVHDFDYLSPKVLTHLVAYNEALKANQPLWLILSHLVQNKTKSMSEASLREAANNIEVYFYDKAPSRGLFDFNYSNYRKTCDIGLVRPICQLAVSSTNDNVVAHEADLAELARMIQQEPAKVEKLEQESGVTMSQVKANCGSMHNKQGSFFSPIERIRDFIVAGFITEEQFGDQLRTDKALSFYNELDKLCKLV